MTFINEYMSEEDIQKNKLDEKYLKKHPEYNEMPSDFNPQWTINKDENITLQLIGRANPAYVDEYWTEFELNIDGKIFLCRLRYGVGGSISFREAPYIIVWDLVSISPNNLHEIQREYFFKVLKEAVTVFGYDGARKQIPNTIVKFNF